MGQGSVTSKSRAYWKLNPPHDGNTQGIVVSAFTDLPEAMALFLCFAWPENGPDSTRVGKGEWLKNLAGIAPITDADGKEHPAAALAFTYSGLQKMGLPADTLATFSQPFREGMYQEDRLRRLGDRKLDEWEPTVIPNGPIWSGNVAVVEPKAPAVAASNIRAPKEDKEYQTQTAVTVHALLLLYGHTEKETADWADKVQGTLAAGNVQIVRRLRLQLFTDPNTGLPREHFGFADGISQPVPYQADEETGDKVLVMSDNSPAVRDDVHGVPLGDILMGHINSHHESAPGPFVATDDPACNSRLLPGGAPAGFLNFGLNGSYLVVRELRQYVGAFWQSMEKVAAELRAQDPSASHVDADWIAERIIGRTTDGDMLCPGAPGHLGRDAYGGPENQFRYRKGDPDGFGCPMGSHVRRANPRDGLAKNVKSGDTLLDAANYHRILRRGRKFGPPAPADRKDDGAERGLLFMCLNTDIARQFEFVQQTWLLNSSFATLFDETDPLVGPQGRFTIPTDPLRRIANVETFIQMAGGEYFFLPSMPALDYLAALSSTHPSEPRS